MRKLFLIGVMVLGLSACGLNSHSTLGQAGAVIENGVLNDAKALTATVSQSVVPSTEASRAAALKAAQPAVVP